MVWRSQISKEDVEGARMASWITATTRVGEHYPLSRATEFFPKTIWMDVGSAI